MIEVILPTKGNHSYLSNALHSLSIQTYSEFQVLIIDNSENEQGAEMIRALAQRDRRFKVLKFERDPSKETTLGMLLNFGLYHCSQNFVARQDDDDISHPKRFEKQLKYMGNSEICGTQGIFLNESGLYQYASNLPSKSSDIRKYLPYANPLIHSSVLMRRDKIAELGYYDEELTNGQDLDLWVRASNYGFRISNLNSSLVSVRIRKKSITGMSLGSSSRVRAEDIFTRHNQGEEMKTLRNMWWLYLAWPDSNTPFRKRARLAITNPKYFLSLSLEHSFLKQKDYGRFYLSFVTSSSEQLMSVSWFHVL